MPFSNAFLQWFLVQNTLASDVWFFRRQRKSLTCFSNTPSGSHFPQMPELCRRIPTEMCPADAAFEKRRQFRALPWSRLNGREAVFQAEAGTVGLACGIGA